MPAKFVVFGMPAGFVDELRQNREKITGKAVAQADDLLDATGDTARIREFIVEARELLRRLDTSVTNRFRRHAEVMAQWRVASRVHRSPRAGEGHGS